MILDSIFENFYGLVYTRIKKRIFTTEDSIRYTFFAAILQEGGVHPHEIILEYPHPTIKGGEIDTLVLLSDGDGFAFEFKYDRAIPSEKNSPRTYKAGKVFHDIFRLSKIHQKIRRVFIYLTDKEMVNYFSNPNNGLVEVFSLEVGRDLLIDPYFIASKSSTFKNAVGETSNVIIRALFSRDILDGYVVRAYEVFDVGK